MLNSVSASWWIFLLRGILALLLGILAFANPVLLGFSLLILFGVYALADGICCLSAVLSGRSARGGRAWLAFIGIIGILAGLLIFFNPGEAMAFAIYFIGFWAIFRGISEIIAAIFLRKEIHNEWVLVLTGVCSLIFGILVLASPLVVGLALIWLIGIYAFIAGIFLILFSIRLHKHRKTIPGS